MFTWFRTLIDRVKLVLAVRAVQEMEADAQSGVAGRPAELRRLAAGCDAEGLSDVAADLRRKAATLERDGGASPSLPNLLSSPSTPVLPAATTGSRGKRGA